MKKRQIKKFNLRGDVEVGSVIFGETGEESGFDANYVVLLNQACLTDLEMDEAYNRVMSSVTHDVPAISEVGGEEVREGVLALTMHDNKKNAQPHPFFNVEDMPHLKKKNKTGIVQYNVSCRELMIMWGSDKEGLGPWADECEAAGYGYIKQMICEQMNKILATKALQVAKEDPSSSAATIDELKEHADRLMKTPLSIHPILVSCFSPYMNNSSELKKTSGVDYEHNEEDKVIDPKWDDKLWIHICPLSTFEEEQERQQQQQQQHQQKQNDEGSASSSSSPPPPPLQPIPPKLATIISPQDFRNASREFKVNPATLAFAGQHGGESLCTGDEGAVVLPKCFLSDSVTTSMIRHHHVIRVKYNMSPTRPWIVESVVLAVAKGAAWREFVMDHRDKMYDFVHWYALKRMGCVVRVQTQEQEKKKVQRTFYATRQSSKYFKSINMEVPIVHLYI